MCEKNTRKKTVFKGNNINYQMISKHLFLLATLTTVAVNANPDDSKYMNYIGTYSNNFCLTTQTSADLDKAEWCMDSTNTLTSGHDRHSMEEVPSANQGLEGKGQLYCAGECKNKADCYAFLYWESSTGKKCHFFTYLKDYNIKSPHVQSLSPVTYKISKCYIKHTYTKPSGDTTDISADCNTAPIAQPTAPVISNSVVGAQPTAPATCTTDQKIVSKKCEPCPTGEQSCGGDPSGADTQCYGKDDLTAYDVAKLKKLIGDSTIDVATEQTCLKARYNAIDGCSSSTSAYST